MKPDLIATRFDEFMAGKRGDKADYGAWHSERHGDPVGVGESGRTSQPIESSADRHELSRVPKCV